MVFLNICFIIGLQVTLICGNISLKFDRFLPKVELNGKKCRDRDLLSVIYQVSNSVFCAGFCTNDESCRSIFYKSSDKSCDICSVDYADSTGLTDIAGTIYLALFKSFGGHIYSFASSKMKFYEAKDYCIAHGGYILQIDTAEENQFIEDSYPEVLAIWVGYTDERGEGQWEWLTYNSTTGYTNWRPSSDPADPANHRLDQNCAAVTLEAEFQWGDRDCYKNMFVICEIDRSV